MAKKMTSSGTPPSKAAATPKAVKLSPFSPTVSKLLDSDGGSWIDSDFDLLLVLPLPEALAARAPAAKIKDASLLESLRRAANAHSEAHLRKGLQLGLSGTAADGTAGATSSNAWLIATLRERVLRAGLTCKVLKLTPHPDEATEGPGEHEVQSGHMVTVLCIGASKNAGDAVSATRASQSLPQPTALPAPRATVASTPSSEAPAPRRAKLRRLDTKFHVEPIERFPRLEEEVERLQMKLATYGEQSDARGPPMRYRRDKARYFPPFKSKLRQLLIEGILHQPRRHGGAGIDLAELLASGRVREVVSARTGLTRTHTQLAHVSLATTARHALSPLSIACATPLLWCPGAHPR